jgi:very-short-patch-repair endonuclease
MTTRTNIGRARRLRQDQTEIEARMWSRLRNRQLDGFKFRRQFPIEGYIADFVCIDAKLIVELDGSQHAEQLEYDAERTKALEAAGFDVLRFWNGDVIESIEGVLETVRRRLRAGLF